MARPEKTYRLEAVTQKSKPSTFETFTRAVIMLGTLVVGSLAWFVYGPPPERLAPVLNRIGHFVAETVQSIPGPSAPSTAPKPSGLVPWTGNTPENLSLAEVTGQTNAAAAAPWPPAVLRPEPLSETDTPVADLAAPETALASLGATEVKLEPWGQSGLYRCQCVVPIEGSPQMVRNFDSIESTPEAASRGVASAIRTWRESR